MLIVLQPFIACEIFPYYPRYMAPFPAFSNPQQPAVQKLSEEAHNSSKVDLVMTPYAILPHQITSNPRTCSEVGVPEWLYKNLWRPVSWGKKWKQALEPVMFSKYFKGKLKHHGFGGVTWIGCIWLAPNELKWPHPETTFGWHKR